MPPYSSGFLEEKKKKKLYDHLLKTFNAISRDSCCFNTVPQKHWTNNSAEQSDVYLVQS